MPAATLQRTCTSRERIKRFFAREVPDRVPIDYSANPGIDRRLKEHFGLAVDDGEGLRRALGVDFRGIGARYVGPRLHEPQPGVEVDALWGIHRRRVEHETGSYMDYCDFPLREADVETIAGWPMPSPDDYDYSQVAAACARHDEYGLFVGGAGLGDVINSTGFVRGTEQILVDLITGDPAGMLLVDRKLDITLEVTRRVIEAARGRIDFMWLGEDLGTQRAPMISLELYRAQIRPRHQRLVDLAKSFDLPVMIHTCGSSSWAYEDMISMGIDAVDTLQPEAVDMSPEHLKRTFGGRLSFHGCISTAGPVARGTVDDVVADCRRTLEVMMPGGGYAFSPTHSLQDNSPTENVVAMYETAQRLGRYS
jgi:uroporphyrinogen decarboxylase